MHQHSSQKGPHIYIGTGGGGSPELDITHPCVQQIIDKSSTDHRQIISRSSTGHRQVIDRQIIDRSSTGHLQAIDRSSTGHRQVIDRPSTDIYRSSIGHLQVIDRSSTEHLQVIDRSSTDHLEVIDKSSTDHQQVIDRSFPPHDLQVFQDRFVPELYDTARVAAGELCSLHDLQQVYHLNRSYTSDLHEIHNDRLGSR